jgi:hypothetical protein
VHELACALRQQLALLLPLWREHCGSLQANPLRCKRGA